MTNVQLKSDGPWLVIDGNPVEILDQIGAVFPDLATTDVTQLPSVVAKAQVHWREQVGVAAGLGGTEIAHGVAPNVTSNAGHPPLQVQQAGPTSPAQSTPAVPAQAAPAGGSRIEQGRFNDSYEWGHPRAPITPLGQQAVLKRGVSKAHKPYARWIDPRSKAIPSVYASGARQDPPDVWDGEFANGV